MSGLRKLAVRNFVLFLVAVFICHSLLQFYSWSVAAGNTAKPSTAFETSLWPIFSFPLFYVIHGQSVDKNFESWCVVNSLIWGVLGSWVIATARRRRQVEA